MSSENIADHPIPREHEGMDDMGDHMDQCPPSTGAAMNIKTPPMQPSLRSKVNDMSDFDLKVKAAAEHAVLKFIGEGGWLLPNYEARLKLPPEWMAQAWALVDRDALLRKLAERIESELVDRMVNHMAAELATDIKQILSVQERREALRGLARDHMTAIMRKGE